jgi:hypothetical protein
LTTGRSISNKRSDGGSVRRNGRASKPDPDRLREQAVHELFVRFDVEGGTLVAAHPQPNENAWLIGQALMNAGLLPTQLVMGMVEARGDTPTPTT